MNSFLVFLSLALRSFVSLWGHSGEGNPPMYGDAEAQRHWMEITINLPIGQWYLHSPQNDLLYWGLDYPPLTAYVSYLYGMIGSIIVPELVELYQSRGHESVSGKLFMRSTVLLSDALIFIPVMLFIGNKMIKAKEVGYNKLLYRLACLSIPGLLLIDHGHFQYNGVCLGLSLLGVALISYDYDILGSICYCMSLNFKQMSLYYAPVFFLVLLRKCLLKPYVISKLAGIAKLGITVMLTFAVLWYPFCIYSDPVSGGCLPSLLQVLHRQFPFSRGIFEDKVANIWYTLSVVIDFRQLLSTQQLVWCSLGLTLMLLSPIAVILLVKPSSMSSLLLALMNSSLAFFLASFQVINILSLLIYCYVIGNYRIQSSY